MGEPAGVGPELVARIWQDRSSNKLKPFVFIGSEDAIKAASPNIPTQTIDDAGFAANTWETALPVMDIPIQRPVEPGILNVENGSSVIAAIDKAVEITLNGSASGIVTAPIHKAALYNAGFEAPGHTEYLAKLCGLPTGSAVMMLAAGNLRVIPVTVHIPLKDVAKSLRADAIVHAGLTAVEDLQRRFGIPAPRIAVAGLNPHAGEDGTIGMEEGTHIMPAIWQLRDAGLHVTDPMPADTLFHAEARENYDVVLCMYHDQALIPIKTVDFWGGVNITLGLPIIRTSPDHGTALNLAGTGRARTESMLAAIQTAEAMVAQEALSSNAPTDGSND